MSAPTGSVVVNDPQIINPAIPFTIINQVMLKIDLITSKCRIAQEREEQGHFEQSHYPTNNTNQLPQLWKKDMVKHPLAKRIGFTL